MSSAAGRQVAWCNGGWVQSMAMQELLERLEGFGSPRVVLVGDFMLDRWVFGSAERLSLEAPVPVLRRVRQETFAGGAGGIAQAIAALGGKVICIGLIGEDADGAELCRLLAATGADTSRLIRLAGRPTTVQTRYVGLAQQRHARQMLRVDAESAEPPADRVMEMLTAAVRGQMRECDVLALEDCGRGVFSDLHTPRLIAEARKADCAVVVGPAPIQSFRRYRGATMLTANRHEAALASGVGITDQATLERAARQILLDAEAEAVAVTLDKEGALLLCRDGQARRFATRPRAVYDVSGAGDEVLAALAVALAEGCSYDDAVALANLAAGLEVEQFGVVAITRRQILDELRRQVGLRRSKLIDRAVLAGELDRRRKQGQTVVFTNGCFDLLHMGHIRYLQDARSLGACLVVAINSDQSVRRLKGPTRPITGQNERAEMLGALECVDYVTLFDEDTPEALLELLRPEILVKGGSTSVIVGREFVESYGGTVKNLELVEGLSTTKIIEKVLSTHDVEEEKSEAPNPKPET